MTIEIKVRENGPYLVSGGPIAIIDADGNPYPLDPEKKNGALCRCGGSTTKPFCDGTHSKTGFQAAERGVAREEGEGAA